MCVHHKNVMKVSLYLSPFANRPVFTICSIHFEQINHFSRCSSKNVKYAWWQDSCFHYNCYSWNTECAFQHCWNIPYKCGSWCTTIGSAYGNFLSSLLQQPSVIWLDVIPKSSFNTLQHSIIHNKHELITVHTIIHQKLTLFWSLDYIQLTPTSQVRRMNLWKQLYIHAAIKKTYWCPSYEKTCMIKFQLPT